ncbi:MAG: YabP/YqfC family sporulation protein [Oscillospiraceae bacterium]
MRKSRRAARTAPREGERGKTEKVVSKIAQVLEVPENSILNTCQMELLSNREAVVEGCQGVLEYDDTTVRLNMGSMIVRFLGRNLQIKGMTADSLVVEGFITSIEYMV